MLDETTHTCPYCGEPISLLVDASAGSASYIEDCSVCCQPINVHVAVDESGGLAAVHLAAEDD